MNHSLFATKHLILIAISIMLIVSLYFITRKWKFKNICKTLLIVAIICEIVKTLTYIVINEDKYGGILPKSDLPFQLCSIQLIFIAIVYFTKNENIRRVLLCFMMPSCLFGGLAAILIATSSALNVWVITCQYFSYHICLCVFSLHLFTNKEYKWNIKDYRNSLIFIVCVFFFAIYINSMMYDGVSSFNFMYVVKPPQDNLPYLNDNNGWLSYMGKYALLVFICITLCYAKPIISFFVNLKKTKKLQSSEVQDNQNNN